MHSIRVDVPLRLLALSLAALWLQASCASLPTEKAAFPGTCSRVALIPPPEYWVFSAAWGPRERELLLADHLGGGVLVYGRTGEFLRRHRYSEFRTGAIQWVGEELLVQHVGVHLVWLGPDLQPRHAVDLDSIRRAGGTEHGWWFHYADQVLRVGGRLIVHGQVRRAQTSAFKNGLFWADLHLESALDTIYETDGHRFYGPSARPLSVVVDDRPFFLALDHGRARILELGQEIRELQAFPDQFRRLPGALPPGQGGEGLVAMKRAWERMPLPHSVYSAGSSLWLLAHKPVETGGREWLLFQIDIVEDRLVRTLRLPTFASDIVVVPGTRTWALLEKGSPFPPAHQEIKAVAMVPADWIRASNSPLLVGREPLPDLCGPMPKVGPREAQES